MKSLLLAAASVVALQAAASTALAADPPQLPPVVETDIFDWSGFYAGANIGGAWTPSDATSVAGPLFPPFLVLPPFVVVPTIVVGANGTLGAGGSDFGIIGGGQIGYNWQRDRLVFGLEADAVLTGLNGSTGTATRFDPPLDQTVTVNFGSIDWMASFRGRAGYAVNKALFYLTAGGAVAQIGPSTTTVVHGPGINLPAGTFSANNGGSAIIWGWTGGAGVDFALNDNWSFGGEVRYTGFGNQGVTFTVPDGLGGVFAVGQASQRLGVGQATVRVNYHPN